MCLRLAGLILPSHRVPSQLVRHALAVSTPVAGDIPSVGPVVRHVRSEVLTAVKVLMIFFRVVMSCGLVAS